MFIVLGATGHVGSATAEALLAAGEAVTVVTRDAQRGEPWRARGADVAVADLHDVDRMRSVLRRGRRAFLVNPPADPGGDTDAVERATVRCLLAALDGAGLEKAVAQSTYGAQPGEALGDLSVLHELEQGLRVQPTPATILRAAFHMSNWDACLEPVRRDGVLATFYPADLELPMVAPVDLGRAAARLLLEPVGREGVHHVEGPARCSSADVAAAFATALGRTVELATTPRGQWEATFRELGFAAAAARAYARMTAVVVDAAYELPGAPERGTVSLAAYVEALARGAHRPNEPPPDGRRCS